MNPRVPFASFAGGEISESIAARFDLAKYGTALSRGRNTLGLVSGGQYNRAGFEFCDYVHDSSGRSELFDFSFSDEQSYCLEFSQNRMRVFYDGAPVLQPALLITAATATNPLTITVPDHGYSVGDRVYLSGVTGMVQINGRTLRITAIVGDVLTFGGVNAVGWGAFTGSGGGVPGNDAGGSGGYPPPPAPGDPDPPQPSYPPVTTPPPYRPIQFVEP